MNNLSKTMNFFQKIGLEKISWSLRRLHCPVDKEALVLEVGSGGNPYFRSNVLLDAYEETRERHWAPLVSDRPTVLGFVENLPFKDKSFDFVIASHVLEHSTNPAQFLSELQRVAKSGYIEIPDAFMERVNPYRDHRLEITVRNNELIIRKKPAWQTDPELVEIYEDRIKEILTKETMRQHPFSFHVRYYWSDKINFTIINPEIDADWKPPQSDAAHSTQATSIKGKLNGFLLKKARTLLAQKRRNNKIALIKLLRCPCCKSMELEEKNNVIECSTCHSEFPIKNNIPNLVFKINHQSNSTALLN